MESNKLVRLSDVLVAATTPEKCDGYNLYPPSHSELLERIRNIPAVDAVEVRHGEWIWDGYVYDAPWQCSECQKLNDIASNYCPNCGARMDGEEEHNALDRR